MLLRGFTVRTFDLIHVHSRRERIPPAGLKTVSNVDNNAGAFVRAVTIFIGEFQIAPRSNDAQIRVDAAFSRSEAPH